LLIDFILPLLYLPFACRKIQSHRGIYLKVSTILNPHSNISSFDLFKVSREAHPPYDSLSPDILQKHFKLESDNYDRKVLSMKDVQELISDTTNSNFFGNGTYHVKTHRSRIFYTYHGLWCRRIFSDNLILVRICAYVNTFIWFQITILVLLIPFLPLINYCQNTRR